MHTETNKNKNKDKHGVPPTKRFSLLGSLVARLEAFASLRDFLFKVNVLLLDHFVPAFVIVFDALYVDYKILPVIID